MPEVMNILEYMTWLYEARRDIISRSNNEIYISDGRMRERGIKRQDKKWLKKVDDEIDSTLKKMEC